MLLAGPDGSSVVLLRLGENHFAPRFIEADFSQTENRAGRPLGQPARFCLH
jgi:hypothetical protein